MSNQKKKSKAAREAEKQSAGTRLIKAIEDMAEVQAKQYEKVMQAIADGKRKSKGTATPRAGLGVIDWAAACGELGLTIGEVSEALQQYCQVPSDNRAIDLYCPPVESGSNPHNGFGTIDVPKARYLHITQAADNEHSRRESPFIVIVGSGVRQRDDTDRDGFQGFICLRKYASMYQAKGGGGGRMKRLAIPPADNDK